jgi:hypothetical protein
VFPHRSSAPPSVPALRPGCRPIATWGEREIPLSFDGQHFTGSFLLAAVQFPILGIDFHQQHGLLVDADKHQLIMTASMKVIKAVAPSGGPGGLFTSVASSSLECRRLFAEFQDVAQPKEEFLAPKHDVQYHLQTSGPALTSKARRLDPARLQDAKQEFEDMEKAGIIRRSESSWASPLHMVQEGRWDLEAVWRLQKAEQCDQG